MTAPPFDTLDLSEKLQEGGFSKPQADAIVKAMTQAVHKDAVTKPELSAALKELEHRMTTKGAVALVALGAYLSAIKFFG